MLMSKEKEGWYGNKTETRGLFQCTETWKLALKKRKAKTVKLHLFHPDLPTWRKKNHTQQ